MTDGRRPVRYDAAEACRYLAARDVKLGRLIERAGPFTLKLKSQHSPFESLLDSIIHQQIHGKAAEAILRRLLGHFGDVHPQPEQLLAAPDDALRAAGLSGSKALALRDLAAKTLDGTVPTLAQIRRLSDVEIVDRLTAVRGIGPWTAEMLLMFRLGRPDVLPATDYGVRKGYALTLGYASRGDARGGKVSARNPFTNEMLPTPAELLKRGERWRPWRYVASWYLWRACDLAGAPSPPPS